MTTRFTDHLLDGTHAERSAATDVPVGTLFACSDHPLIYQSDGSSWNTWATLGGGSGGSSGAVDLLASVALAADAASIAFTGADIPASGYSHLELVLTGRTTQAGTSSPVYVAFNGDTTDANYYRQLAGINGSASYVNAQAGRELLYLAGDTAAAGQGGTSRALIGNYASTTFFKSTTGTVNSAVFTATVGQTWKSTAAIASITLTNPGNFKAGTTAKLYGLK